LGFVSPTKTITSPVVSAFIKSNKYVIYARAIPRPEGQTPKNMCAGLCIDGTVANCSVEEDDHRRLKSTQEGDDYSRALLSKRQLEETDDKKAEPVDCSEYACVPSPLAKNYKKAAKTAYKELKPCDYGIPEADMPNCGDGTCYLGGSKFYDDEITGGRLISKGFLKGAGDEVGGALGFIFALIFMTVGLIMLCKSLQKIFMGQAKTVIKYSVKLNDYLAIAIGVAITIVVQSSSVTTSALTPLCGAGVLPLKKMLPMTLGANIGTTMTAMIAALVDLKQNTLHIALVHLFFNIIGILMWFPVPYMRAIPLHAARLLGLYAAHYRYVPFVYILITFLALPAIFLGLAMSFHTHIALGLVILLVVLGLLGAFEFWWWKGIGGQPGAFMVLSEEDRVKGHRDLVEANATMMGISEEEYEQTAWSLSWTGN